ncbi:hypothetical protein [Viscerimonas tarda]
MKKINIQRDIDSRRNMAKAVMPVMGIETEVKPVKEENDAESEVVHRATPDTGAPAGEKTKKRRRTSEGDIQALPV